MNENAKKWVAALRSGRYRQTRGHLADRSGFCCLGVACELYIEAGNDLSKMPDGRPDGEIRYGDETAQLPNEVQQWLGLRHSTGLVDGLFGRSPMQLSALNDHGMSFEALADTIEDRQEDLFE